MTEKNKLVELLREAVNHMHCPFVLSGLGFRDLRDRIDAALKENDIPLDFEFAEGEGDIENAEWDETAEGFFMAYPDAYTVMDILQFDDYHKWSVSVEREASGRAETLQKAKEAAIKAAKKLR